MNLNAAGGTVPTNEEEALRAEDSDLITLPVSIVGTNCANCKFIGEVQSRAGNVKAAFCNHPQVEQMVTNRMCCIFWDTPGTRRDF